MEIGKGNEKGKEKKVIQLCDFISTKTHKPQPKIPTKTSQIN